MVPPEVVNVIGTLAMALVPRLGTVVVMEVALTTLTLPPGVPLKLTVAPDTKLVPVMVRVVPEGPEDGEIPEIVGT